MAKANQPFEDLSEPVVQAGEQNMAEARGAMDNYFSFLQVWGRNDLTEKMKTYTEKNIAAYAEFVGKLGQAENFQEVFRIQTEFMQTQSNSLTEQARSLGEAYNKAATDATKPFRIMST
jgi:hypothetical protein